MKGSLLDDDIAWCSHQQVWVARDIVLPLQADAASSAALTDHTLEALYRDQSPRLLRRFARYGNREDARDLVQEAFFRLVRLGADRLASVHKAEAYLASIAGNLVRDRAKAALRHQAASHEPLDEGRLHAPDQQRLLEQRDLLNRLERAMIRLKPRTREIFMAHRLDGLTYAEIAARTGLSVKGVEKQMCKAIAQLDQMLHRF